MNERLLHNLGDPHEPADLARGYPLVDPHTSTDTIFRSKAPSINQSLSDRSHHNDSPLLSSLFRKRNLSTASVLSNLFTHFWRRPATYNIADLSSYISSTPLTRITRLKWCKNRRGVQEFLLLEIESPENGSTLWLRLERRMHKRASLLKFISFPVPSGDTAKICNDVSLLFDPSRNQVQVETEFTVPPLLQRLGDLLSILKENSPNYKLPSENCYFFCAVIYEILFSTGKGMNVTGTPSIFSLSRGAEAKEKIKKLMESSVPEPSSISSVEEKNPLPTEGSSVSPPSRVINSGEASSRGILPDVPPHVPPHVRQDGRQEIREDVGADGSPSSPYRLPLRTRPGKASPTTSGGGDHPSEFPQPPPKVRPEAMRPKLNPGQGRMCVAVDFGTVLSGVACGLSSDTVEQILWPGPNRKVPTCLIYDAQGHVVAWGHRALAVELERGWIRCELFKLLLDSNPNAASNLTSGMLPLGKEPIDVITDYLRELWESAKQKILNRGYTNNNLQCADIWLSIPATWTVRNGEMMRDAAYAAGLVAHEGSQEYAGGRDRLHIICEPEAGAVHCILWKDLGLKPNQSFMVCDAGGGTIDTAIYQVLGNVTQIAEQCASSGASCGSHFLDINFRAYLEEWHKIRNIRLSEKNLARYMHAFTYLYKLEFNGKQDRRDLHFECFDVSDYYNLDLSDDEFFNGQLVVPVSDLQERVFDPIVNKGLGVLEAQLKRVGSVDALLLVGGFSASPYLFDRIWNTFHERLHGRILNPVDPDIATSLGTAQSGLAESLIQRPIGAPTIIASKSYIIGVGPNLAIGRGGNWKLRTAAGMMNGFNGVFEAQYLVVKGALLKKGEPVLQEFTKTSSNSSDSVFVARVYTSDSAEMRADTSGGDLEHIVDWEIDLSAIQLFKQNAQNSSRKRFDTVFEIGIEIESQEAHVVWFSGGERGGRLRLPAIPGN